MNKDRLQVLLIKYLADTMTEAELDEFLDYVAQGEEQESMHELLADVLEKTDVDSSQQVNAEDLYQRIISDRGFTRQKPGHNRRWLRGVAAALLLSVLGVWLADRWGSRYDSSGEPVVVTRTVTSAPSDRPLLRLADGRVVDLDTVENGQLAIDGGVEITLDGDVLSYVVGDIPNTEEVATNTIDIPKGRQYQIILPDGSRLWLNAASSVTYPVRFSRERREVEIAGEAYFDVTNATDWPFVVTTAQQRIEVLGTSFNVSAYADDAFAHTTLVSGQVSVSFQENPAEGNELESVVLRPGQQVSSYSGRANYTVKSVDPEDFVSWKDHLFVFNNEEISEVMKKVSRWYNVEVEYKDGMAGKRIGGSIPRLDKVADLMEALKDTGLLRYEMKGGTIIITK